MKRPIDNPKGYEETSFIDEALHRLVELHYYLGLVEEAHKYASLLGYNYKSRHTRFH